jgi:hypothetical protein
MLNRNAFLLSGAELALADLRFLTRRLVKRPIKWRCFFAESQPGGCGEWGRMPGSWPAQREAIWPINGRKVSS